MKTLFIAFLVGGCCFLSACNLRTGGNNIEKYKEAVAFKLDSAEVYKDLGASYLEQGKLDKAIVEFKKAVQIDPRFVEAHYLLADVYSLKGEGLLSRKSLEKAMALEGSYIIDTRRGIMDRTHTIIESTPSAVMESDESIKRTFPPEFFEDPAKIDVPRRRKSLPK